MEAGAETVDRITAKELAFIAARDSFYLASTSENGWPYVQHRGGATGFVRHLGAIVSGSPTFAATDNISPSRILRPTTGLRCS
ncbi:hypothetical protein [Sphingomonas sp. 22R3R2A-7]|uniref:hypothetical protein n=1 Tax=Sphingomonas sp. 22R3R2A-7 TaxID=3050230 RepID=UPI003FA6ED64